MAGAIGLPLRMNCGLKALAEVIVAVALVNQTKIPHTDGQLPFSVVLQEISSATSSGKTSRTRG